MCSRFKYKFGWWLLHSQFKFSILQHSPLFLHHSDLFVTRSNLTQYWIPHQESFCVCAKANERRRYPVTPSLICRAHIQNDPCCSAIINVEHRPDLELTIGTPWLALLGDPSNICCEYFEENKTCYNATALYHIFPPIWKQFWNRHNWVAGAFDTHASDGHLTTKVMRYFLWCLVQTGSLVISQHVVRMPPTWYRQYRTELTLILPSEI